MRPNRPETSRPVDRAESQGTLLGVGADTVDLVNARVNDRAECRAGPCAPLWPHLEDLVLGMTTAQLEIPALVNCIVWVPDELA